MPDLPDLPLPSDPTAAREGRVTAPAGGHDPDACAQAWVALRSVHAAIAGTLAAALARECGLTVNEFEVLAQLQADPKGSRRVRLGDLGDVVSLSQPAISRLVSRLEAQGLVQRIDAADDRRSVLVETTAAGIAAFRCAAPVHAACVRQHFTSRLTPADEAAFLTILARLQQ